MIIEKKFTRKPNTHVLGQNPLPLKVDPPKIPKPGIMCISWGRFRPEIFSRFKIAIFGSKSTEAAN